jgi:hypothetical protein
MNQEFQGQFNLGHATRSVECNRNICRLHIVSVGHYMMRFQQEIIHWPTTFTFDCISVRRKKSIQTKSGNDVNE